MSITKVINNSNSYYTNIESYQKTADNIYPVGSLKFDKNWHTKEDRIITLREINVMRKYMNLILKENDLMSREKYLRYYLLKSSIRNTDIWKLIDQLFWNNDSIYFNKVTDILLTRFRIDSLSLKKNIYKDEIPILLSGIDIYIIA